MHMQSVCAHNSIDFVVCVRSAHKRDSLFCTGIHDSSSCPVLEEHGTPTYIYFIFIVLTVQIEHVELLHQECSDVSGVTVTRSIGVP